MQYDAIVAREGKSFTIEFPDCLGCQTFADNEAEVLSSAREALEGWLEANLAERRVPRAELRSPKGPAREGPDRGSTIFSSSSSGRVRTVTSRKASSPPEVVSKHEKGGNDVQPRGTP